MNIRTRTTLRQTSTLLLLFVIAGCSQPQRHPAALYQVSTLQALMEGAYDGTVTFDELSRQGDTGIGTFDALDGEMIMLDGRAWQIRADGLVLTVPPCQTTPFATVAPFHADQQVDLAGPLNMVGLATAIDIHLPTPNIFYLMRIDARFARMKTRSVPRQQPPYKPLLEVAKQQSVFEARDIDGTLIALRCPDYAKGINMPGWHMHFLSRDRRLGGHVLDLQLAHGQARLAHLRQFTMVLPSQGRFIEADLTRTTTQDLKKVEQAPTDTQRQ